jgi:hypothetical protein
LSTLSLDGEASIDGVREGLGTFCWWKRASSVSDWALEVLHQMASDMNKSKRRLPPKVDIAVWKR